ncbi:Hsp70 family protein [Geodermatophilus sp. URMC 65]
MGYCLGVDLGTTSAAAAVADGVRVEVFPLGDRSPVMPSVVHVRDDGALVAGDEAAKHAVSDPDRVASEITRRLGNPTPVVLGGTSLPATDLLAALLQEVVARVTAQQGLEPEVVVLTHPANWGPFRQGLFEEVPQLVGIPDARTITEPEAAVAYHAATRQPATEETIAVYDLGGGTFDAAVLRRNGRSTDVLGTPESIERLGGADFDEAVLSFVDDATGGALAELDRGDPRAAVALARLRRDCTLAKEALSLDTETVIPVVLPGIRLEVRLTRERFEELVLGLVESTITTFRRALCSAGVSPEVLSAVLLIGGSSRIPLVARLLSRELGRPLGVDPRPDHAVALGAAASWHLHSAAHPQPPRGRP